MSIFFKSSSAWDLAGSTSMKSQEEQLLHIQLWEREANTNTLTKSVGVNTVWAAFISTGTSSLQLHFHSESVLLGVSPSEPAHPESELPNIFHFFPSLLLTFLSLSTYGSLYPLVSAEFWAAIGLQWEKGGGSAGSRHCRAPLCRAADTWALRDWLMFPWGGGGLFSNGGYGTTASSPLFSLVCLYWVWKTTDLPTQNNVWIKYTLLGRFEHSMEIYTLSKLSWLRVLRDSQSPGIKFPS